MSQITRLLALLALSTAALLAAGCVGDAEPSASFPVESGVMPTRPLGALTPDERSALCNAVGTTTLTFLDSDVSSRHVCTLAGALESTAFGTAEMTETIDEHACARTRGDCLKLPPAEPATPLDCTRASLRTSATCTTTIAEYEGCLEQLFETVSDTFESTTCSTITVRQTEPFLNTGELDATQVPSCDRIQRECPGLLWPVPNAVLVRAANRWLDVQAARAVESAGGDK